MNDIFLFVYGTLKKGQHNHYLLGDSEFVTEAKTTSDLSLYIKKLPFLIKESSENGVYGEIYKVSEKVLARIDALEGHPTFYRRTYINVESPSKMEVFAYLYNYPKFLEDGVKVDRFSP